jgi:hypothetical protein
MEIKVISIENNEGATSSEMTSIFEGEEISHRRILWKINNDFVEKSAKLTKNIDSNMLGIESWLFQKENNSKMPEGYFIFILFFRDNCPHCLICRHSEIYITNKGQTVDKITIN